MNKVKKKIEQTKQRSMKNPKNKFKNAIVMLSYHWVLCLEREGKAA